MTHRKASGASAPRPGQSGITAESVARAAWGHPPSHPPRAMALAVVPPVDTRSLAIDPADRARSLRAARSDPRQLSLPFDR